MNTFETEVLDKEYLTHDVIELTLSRPSSFTFQPGQFLSLHIISGDTSRWKPYSIYSGVDEETIRLCIKIVPKGFASAHFEQVEQGHTYEMRAPFGHFTLTDAPHHIFLSTGTGIAPFGSMIASVSSCELYHGTRTQNDLIHREKWEALEDDTFTYHPVLSREDWEGKEGYVQDNITIRKDAVYYICGLREFVLDTVSYLKNQDIPEQHIKYERYS